MGGFWERDGLEGAGMDVEAEEVVAFGTYKDVVIIFPFLDFRRMKGRAGEGKGGCESGEGQTWESGWLRVSRMHLRMRKLYHRAAR